MSAVVAQTGGCERGPSRLDTVLRERLVVEGITGDPLASRNLPSADSPLARLGRSLFYAKSLSADGDVACASCHHPELGGGDGLGLPVGVASGDPHFLGPERTLVPAYDPEPAGDGGPNGRRNAPALVLAALYDRSLGADGRVESLSGTPGAGGIGATLRTPDSFGAPDASPNRGLIEAFVADSLVERANMAGHSRFPVESRRETREALAARLRGEDGRVPAGAWLPAFRVGFNQPSASAATLVTPDNVARALAAYVRSLAVGDTPFARFIGGDAQALSVEAKRGALDFYTSRAEGGAGCYTCHAGDRFTDESFRRAGFPQVGRGYRADATDRGRAEVSRDPVDAYAFRVPSLLHVAATAPYGHAGTFATLDEVLAYHADASLAAGAYDPARDAPADLRVIPYPQAAANTGMAASSIDPALTAVSLDDARRADLVAFLGAITAPCMITGTCAGHAAPDALDDVDGTLLVRSATTSPKVRADDPADASRPPPTRATGHSTALDFAPPSPVLVNGPEGFSDQAAVRGIDHVHGFTAADYLLYPEDLLTISGVSAGDLDGDARPDLVFASGTVTGLAVYRGREDGSYENRSADVPTSIGKAYASAALADLDADRRTDAVLANLRPGAARIVRQTATGWTEAFSVPMARTTTSVGIGDLDGDGDPDLATGHWDIEPFVGGAPFLLRNGGGLTFASADGAYRTTFGEIPQQYFFAPSLVDFDEDGDRDALVTGDFGTSRVLRQVTGRFEDATDPAVITDQNGMGSAIGDYDGDGDLDWFVSSIWDPNGVAEGNWGVTGNRLYRNDGGTFVDVSVEAGVRPGFWGWGACFADFDDDGDLDLFHENGFGFFEPLARTTLDPMLLSTFDTLLTEFIATPARYFENQGDGTFVERASALGLGTPSNGRGVSCFDADLDGDVDIAVAGNQGPPRLYVNGRGADASHAFLSVRVIGAAPNTDALGTRVTARVSGRSIVREVNVWNHHNSHDPLDLHFGLGAATQLDELRLKWPDGAPDTVLTGVLANRALVVFHPSLDPWARLDAREQAAVLATLVATEARLDALTSTPASVAALAMEQRRRGATPAFDASARYAALRAAATGGDADRFAAFARVINANAPFDGTARAALDRADGLEVDALYCDTRPVPASFAADLAASSEERALRTVATLGRLGCALPLGRSELDSLVAAVASAIELDDGTLDVADLEALAALAYAGRLDMVSARAVEAVLDAALPGGGYAVSCPLRGECLVPSDESATRAAYAFLSGLAYHAYGRVRPVP